MSEFYYREIDGVSKRMTGPFDSEDEARRAARYKGLMHVEVLKRNGTSFDKVEKGVVTPVLNKPAPGPSAA